MWSVKGAVLYDKCWEAEEERYHLPSASLKLYTPCRLEFALAAEGGILSNTPQWELEAIDHPGKKLKSSRENIAFDDDDLVGTTQPHDDALVVTLKIGGVPHEESYDRPG